VDSRIELATNGQTPEPEGEGDDRDRTAEDRDRTSEAHDKASEDRDARAVTRDERAQRREGAAARLDPGAVSDRVGAKRDRQAGAGDRKHAENDRHAASSDRALSAKERAIFLIDELTSAHRRGAGIMELRRDVAKARRTGQPFVLAFIDLDGLKATNDSLGHLAGDQMLRNLVETVRRHLRSYDLLVRYGGDEFLCGLLDVGHADATERFARINTDLVASCGASMTAGLAQLMADESLEDLIERADKALYAQRQTRTRHQ